MYSLRLIIGISGASGAAYSERLLRELKNIKDVETYLIITKTAEKIIEAEGLIINDIVALANHYYDSEDLMSPITSGSFKVDGMVVIPCSMKTLAGISNGYSDNLLLRAADVIIKEGKRLILVPRETPLNIIHLENMLKLARIGVTILAAMPAFYYKPKTADDLVAFIVGKVLELLERKHCLYTKWKE